MRHTIARSLLALLFLLAQAPSGHAISLIRDAEIEDLLRDYARPIFREGGLNSNAIDIILVRDDSFNAFVTGGQKIFLHTGLLERTTEPEQVVGVLAHEAGHIAGGHLARTRSQMENAYGAMILGYVLGAAAAAAGGGGAGAAVLSGTSNIAERTMLRYSRVQEQSADQYAVTVLRKAGWSAQGLRDAMTLINNDRLWRSRDADPYAQSHPLSEARQSFFDRETRLAPDRQPLGIHTLRLRHARMRGKLQGFLDDPQTTLLRLEREGEAIGEEERLHQQYARTIALYRLPDIPAADAEMAKLQEQFNDDPYLIELKAQMALENGNSDAALQGYQEAVQILPKQPLLQLGLASALLAQQTTAGASAAVTPLEFVTSREPSNLTAWRLLAQAYGQSGRTVEADLALAEIAWRRRDRQQFDFLIARADKNLTERQGKIWLRLQDLKKMREDWPEEPRKS